jgi:ATP-dependent protease Clp ATPase subunit
MEPLDFQKSALAEITARARAFYRGNWRNLEIRPRWPMILISPTGQGKTTTAAMAASAVGASLCRASAPSYMPCGATNRGARETILVIGEHIAKHPRTLLVIDEICKLSHNPSNDSAWLGYVRSELLEILDGRFPAGMKEIEDEKGNEVSIDTLTTKLRETVFCLGIATFQNWHDSSRERRSMGFGAEHMAPKHNQITSDIITETIPRELINRFGKIIQIPELQPHDYHQIARQAEARLPESMREPFRREAENRIDVAIKGKQGARFIEEVLTAVLINMPEPKPSNQLTLDDL